MWFSINLNSDKEKYNFFNSKGDLDSFLDCLNIDSHSYFDIDKKGFGPFIYGTLTTLDESPIEEGVIWTGSDNGNVHITRDGGKIWTKLNSNIVGNPGYWVSRITASNHIPGTAYVTYSGLRRDDFRPFIFKTDVFFKSWVSLVSNLPYESINVI